MIFGKELVPLVLLLLSMTYLCAAVVDSSLSYFLCSVAWMIVFYLYVILIEPRL